ncbi:hypothetical protein D3C87_1267490 [compost metagenome]
MRIDDLMQDFMAEVPGCPDETARVAIVKAFRTMCDRGKVWTEWMDPVDLIDGEADYTIDTPEFASIAESVIEVWLGGQQLWPKGLGEIAMILPNWQEARGNPMYFNSLGAESETITLYPTPYNETRQLRVRGLYMPVRSATTIPDEVTSIHQEVIEMGAKATLMLQSKQPWTDVKMGEYWRQRFENKVEELAINFGKGNAPSSDRVKPRRFGA